MWGQGGRSIDGEDGDQNRSDRDADLHGGEVRAEGLGRASRAEDHAEANVATPAELAELRNRVEQTEPGG